MMNFVTKPLTVALMVLCVRASGADDPGVPVAPPPAGAESAVMADEAGGPPLFAAIPQKPVNYREPPREYTSVSADDWTIEVEKQLLAEEPELAGKAVARLAKNFSAALAVLPEASRDRLKKVRIFLMYGPKAKGDGRDNGFEYHQQRAPACYKTLDPRWGNSIVAYCAENYVWQSDCWALKLPLHEMAHAYHLEQWPEDRVEIVKAYDNAMSRNLYRNLKDDQGTVIDKAYAIENPIEYFAELSCMFFTGCDYPPRNRKELQTYDPEGYAMIRDLWGVKD